MKKHRKVLLGIFLCLCAQVVSSQIGGYSFKRPLDGAAQKWQKVVLPEDLYGKVSKDLNDIRIFGITRNGDTVETAYLLRIAANNLMHKDVPCAVVNKPKKDTGYFVVFENRANARVNHLFIDMDPEMTYNPVTLEESRDGASWIMVSDDCEVSDGYIGPTRRSLTRLSFRTTTKRYLRLSTKGAVKPQSASVRIAYEDVSDRVLRGRTVASVIRREDPSSKSTELTVEMRSPVPVEWLKVHVQGTSDYYRPVTIMWLNDSSKTQKGWSYNYGYLTSGILTSADRSPFRFGSTIARKLRILIENQDSPPLRIDSIEVKGCIHELAVKFDPDVDYVLAYGKSDADRPVYDVERFTDNIPYTLNAVSMGREQTIEKPKPVAVEPLFTNKAWFWAVMAVIIAVLGWFSIRMLRNDRP